MLAVHISSFIFQLCYVSVVIQERSCYDSIVNYSRDIITIPNLDKRSIQWSHHMEPQKATRLPTGQFTKWNETEIADYLKEKELSDDVANLFISKVYLTNLMGNDFIIS